jgi:hypothetical protein
MNLMSFKHRKRRGRSPASFFKALRFVSALPAAIEMPSA